MEIQELEEKLKSTLFVLKEDLNGVQAGQVSEKMLKNVFVCYEDGRKNCVLEVASVRVQNSSNLLVKPFMHEDLAIIEKSIANSGLGVNTGKQGHEVLVTFPPVTTKRREELSKLVVEYGNKSKLSGRDIRHNYLKDNKAKTKEEQVKIEKQLMPHMENFNKEVDRLIKDKQESLMKL
ncbi:ribosome-recycling factor [Alphaproteobacteria bacterium endosymbiont of Tiliacea citrago]|uniref:ribosome-recycling factor n=1 Tax=Alphaproteobacteria bacterium endosymbiont of Tiliacea citrago TaxID=3077944 RepID=UPI00313B0643